MNKRYWIFLSLLMLTSFNLRADVLESFSIGEAFSYPGDELLYRETHCQNAEGLERDVFYHDVEGKAIAHKWLDYRHGASTPAFTQHNFLTREKTQVSFQQSQLKMTYQDAIGGVEQEVLDMDQQQAEGPIVVDAGFDEFIRQHWDSLVSGEDHKIRFTLPTRGQLVDLRISARSCGYQTASDQCFTLAMDNWFFRMLVDDIELGYDRETRRLSRYRGLSNIEDENGNGLEVDIRYTYPDSPLQACALGNNRPLADREEVSDHG